MMAGRGEEARLLRQQGGEAREQERCFGLTAADVRGKMEE